MATANSPITGIIEEESVVIDFGKYAGKTIKEVFDLDLEFYNKLSLEKDKGTFAIRRHKDKSFRLYVNPLANPLTDSLDPVAEILPEPALTLVADLPPDTSH